MDKGLSERAGAKVAWGDESARMSNAPRMYLMCGTVFEDGFGRELAEFAKLKPRGMRKLHWRGMDTREKRRSLDALAEVPHWSTVAITAPLLAGARQERGRRKCLERLPPHLEGIGSTSSLPTGSGFTLRLIAQGRATCLILLTEATGSGQYFFLRNFHTVTEQ